MANLQPDMTPRRRYLPLAIISLALLVFGVAMFYRIIVHGHVLYHPAVNRIVGSNPILPGDVTHPLPIVQPNPGPPITPSADELSTATKNGDLATVKRIISAHPEMVNTPDTSENSAPPLLRAINYNHREIVDFLLAHGADVNVQGKLLGRNALHIATFQGDATLVESLLRRGADIDAHENDGGTALFIAAGKGHIDVAKILFRYHPDINMTEKTDHWTPLHAAISGNHPEMVKLLLAHGASLTAKTKMDGFTPLALAQVFQQKDTVAILKKAGAKK